MGILGKCMRYDEGGGGGAEAQLIEPLEDPGEWRIKQLMQVTAISRPESIDVEVVQKISEAHVCLGYPSLSRALCQMVVLQRSRRPCLSKDVDKHGAEVEVKTLRRKMHCFLQGMELFFANLFQGG